MISNEQLTDAAEPHSVQRLVQVSFSSRSCDHRGWRGIVQELLRVIEAGLQSTPRGLYNRYRPRLARRRGMSSPGTKRARFGIRPTARTKHRPPLSGRGARAL